MIDNVHKHNICVNIPSSQTFRLFNNFVINQEGYFVIWPSHTNQQADGWRSLEIFQAPHIISWWEPQNMEEKQHIKQKHVLNLRMVTNYKMEEAG
jgi:hypothetical protein